MEKVIDLNNDDGKDYQFAASDLVSELDWAGLTDQEKVRALVAALILVSKGFPDPQQVIDEVVDSFVEAYS